MTSLINQRVSRTIPLLLIVVLFCPFTYGKVIYVDDDATGINNGTNWANGYMYLQDALADANEAAKPVEIRIGQGIYKPDHGNGYVTGDQQASFLLKEGVALKGGFAGLDGGNPDACDPEVYTTVLSGDLGDNDNRYLSNFTENSHHVIICTDANETAVLDGFTITGGYATESRGGGMYNIDASPTVRDCVFFDNYGSSGGGMANLRSNPVVLNCTFEGNLANMGGGMFSYESQPVVDSCVFYDNATNMLGGGGMHNYVDSNSTVTNCLFVDNSAPFGGGMYNYYANVTITNCTFCNNRAPGGWGAGIHSEVVGHTIVNNCIVWGNNPDQIRAMGGGWGRDFTIDVTYSDVQGGFQGEGNIDVDPFFANPDAGDCHLKSHAGRWNPVSENWVLDYVTSPCIDAGDPNSPVELEPSPNGGIINLGAYGGMIEASKSPSDDLPSRYSGGTGEPNDPYQIATAEDLMVLGEIPEEYDRHFVLMANIDLNPSLPGRKVFDKAVIAPDTDTDQSRFQGIPFTGLFNGNGHIISHLTVTGVSYLGLFGQLGPEAMVFDLALEVVDVNGIDDYIGGLAGYNSGSISASYSTGTVNGDRYVGGLAGDNYNGNIISCYSNATVSGNSYTGGLVGRNGNGSTVTMSYSSGIVLGSGWSVGGLIGSAWGSTVTFCFWDMETSSQSYSEGGTGLTTAEMKTTGTFNTAGWGCNPIWTINEEHDYPRLWWENKGGQPIDAMLSDFLEGEGTEVSPYLIYTVEDASIMANFPCEWDKHFKMMFLAGEGTPENPYFIHTADDIEILNAAPYLQDMSFRLTFVAGEGTQENPYLIYNPEEMNLLKICPYEQNAYYKLGFIAGEGTPENPYQIYSTDELELMGQSPLELDKHFMLMVDIDMSGIVWSEPLIPTFTGTFDGNDHSISNLTIEGESQLGLFGQLTNGAEIKNLGVIDVNIVGSNYNIGALAGRTYDAEVSNCYASGTVTGKESVGGLIGSNHGDITLCYSNSTVNGTGNTGGLLGRHWGTLYLSYSNSTVTDVYISGFRYQYAMGGLVGLNDGLVNRCYSTGTVTGHQDVAGLVGYNFPHGDIMESYSTATVSGTGNFVGGLVGRNDGWYTSITTSFSTGPVTGRSRVGGLVGYSNSIISNSYSTSTVHGNDHVGGLVGKGEFGLITTSYSTGRVSASAHTAGGLMGANYYGSTVTLCFWDTETSGQTISDGGDGKTSAEMQTASTFLETGWDFMDETENGIEDIWWILEGQDYPRLSWDRYRELTISSGNHGYVTEPGEGTFTYDRGAVVQIQAIPDEGYALANWTGTGVNASRVENPSLASTTIILDGDYTLKAVFGQATDLALSSGPNGSVTVPGEGVFQYGEGSVALIQASPNPDYRFVRWIGTAVELGQIANPLAAETTVTINADYTLEALFASFSPIYVDDQAVGTNDGTSWTNAYNNLQDALMVALPGSEIRVAQGLYHPDRGTGWTRGDRTASFKLRNGVTIRGGYAGLGTPDPEAWDTEAFVTLLSGDLDDNDIMGTPPSIMMQDTTRAENSYHVLVGDAGSDNALLEGLTITGGHADGNDPNSKGAGMYLYQSSPTLLSCTFIANSGGYTVPTGPYTRHIYGGGGGLCNDHSSPILISCTFQQNATGANGGGLRNDEQSDPSLTNCGFVNNFSEDSGAGIYNLDSNPTLTGCTFSENFAGNGAGMYNLDSNPTLTGCTFSANSADEAAGGMYNKGADPRLISCEFSYNQSQYNGGAVFNDSGYPRMFNCVFSHNTTPAFGGALSNDQGSFEIINCTFSVNSAAQGGAIYTNSPIKILNSILWYNSPNEIESGKTSIAMEYSNIQGGWQGQNISVDPLFVDIQGDYHLQAGSPCINRGHNKAIPLDSIDLDGDLDTSESIPWDFDGNPRVVGNIVDMGAFESSHRRGH